jgi:hypothetical protein
MTLTMMMQYMTVVFCCADAWSLHVYGSVHRQHDPDHDDAVHDWHGAVWMLDAV